MNSAEKSDNSPWNDLLKNAQAGGAEAKNALFCRLAVRLRPVIKYRLCGYPREDLEDILQDTLATFLEKLNQIKSDPDAYALMILRNKVGNVYQRWHRSKKIFRSMDQRQDSGPTANPGRDNLMSPERPDGFGVEVELKDMTRFLQEAIKKLPLFCQTFFLALLEGRKIKEIWRHFKKLEPGLQRNAFDKRIYDCRKKLTEIVEGQI